MNKQLQALLDKGAQYYTPSRTLTLEADAEETLRFSGLNANRYGVNRFMIGGDGLTDVIATASFNNGRDDKFEDVQLQALRNLFLSRSLRGALVIDDGNEMFLTLKNQGSTERTVNVELIGYDSEHLQEKIEQYRGSDSRLPEPEFIYTTQTIPAGSTQRRISISVPSYPLRLYRMAISSDSEDNIRVSIRQDRTRIKPEVFLSQINDEFRDKDIILPTTLDAHVPFDLFVTNTDEADNHTISFIAECYKI